MSVSGRMGIARLRGYANERDLAILRSIQKFKFLTTRHIYELHFALHASYVSGIRACTRVLARLESRRFIQRLPRPVGGSGGGSTSTVWSIGSAGDRILRADDPESGRRSRSFEPAIEFLSHTLAIADLRVLLEQHHRAGLLELLEVDTEPFNWRTFTGRGGRVLTLKPDLATISAVEDEEFFHYWEVDLGTEPIHRLVDKSRLYQQYYDTGIEQTSTGVFPQVVWLLADARRRKRLREAISGDQTLREGLFLISEPDSLTSAIPIDANRPESGAK